MVITKEEVEQHNKNEDAWIIFNEGVYDITKWHKSHPGGTVILHYKGQDATEPIQAFHPDIVKVQKIMEIFKVGDLAEKDRVTKENPKTKLTAEFRELRAELMKEGLIKTDRKMTFYLPHLLQVLFLEVLAVLAYTWTNSLVLTAFILSVSQIQAGWLQHDYGHNSVYSNLNMNQFYHYLTIGVLKGALSEWWKSRHNRHHSKTNTILLDPDIHTEPLFSFSEELVQTKNAKLKHSKHFVKFLEYQHYYWFLFGPPMVTTFLFLLENSVFIVTKASFFDIFSVFLYFVRFDLTFRCYLSIDPLKVIFLYFLMRFMESHWFTWITSMNHLPRAKSTETPLDWVTLQLTATQNTTNGFWFDWSTGHLNYQIEHHLFPEMPRHNYPLVAKRVRELCERNGVEYKEASLWQSTKEIVLKLRDVATIYSNKRKRV